MTLETIVLRRCASRRECFQTFRCFFERSDPACITECLPSSCLNLASTFSRLSIPIDASLDSPSASTRIERAHLAASTREILPLNFGAA